MSEVTINDVRLQRDFGNVTFSKYQKSKVRKELMSCLGNNKIESACHWAAELICAGHFVDLWEAIILFISKHIHLGNPKLPIYLASRMETFKEIVCNGFIDNEIAMRNNRKTRELFAEIIATLCMSRRKHTFDAVKLNKAEAFDMTAMSAKLSAPDVRSAQGLFRSSDPKELYIATNELAYNLSRPVRNNLVCCYWVEWILEFEARCKKRKESCTCERRTWAPCGDKHQTDPVWVIWDAILQEAGRRNDPLLVKIVGALLEIFCIRYGPGVKKRRRFVIYNAIALLTEEVQMSIPIMSNKTGVTAVVKKIDLVYKEIKKNEVSPATDYLFNGTAERSNLEKTVEKLEVMRKLTGI